jgi:non-ribosomal peptide synthetase component F
VDETSNKIANYLIRDGVKKGDVVAIFAHRSTAIVLAIMGVLKAGATFTVIGLNLPSLYFSFPSAFNISLVLQILPIHQNAR